MTTVDGLLSPDTAIPVAPGTLTPADENSDTLAEAFATQMSPVASTATLEGLASPPPLNGDPFNGVPAEFSALSVEDPLFATHTSPV